MAWELQRWPWSLQTSLLAVVSVWKRACSKRLFISSSSGGSNIIIIIMMFIITNTIIDINNLIIIEVIVTVVTIITTTIITTIIIIIRSTSKILWFAVDLSASMMRLLLSQPGLLSLHIYHAHPYKNFQAMCGKVAVSFLSGTGASHKPTDTHYSCFNTHIRPESSIFAGSLSDHLVIVSSFRMHVFWWSFYQSYRQAFVHIYIYAELHIIYIYIYITHTHIYINI